MLLESRVIYDAAGMLPLLGAKRFFPQGDDHPVLVLPGFLASSRSTGPLRQFLAGLGYRAHRWKLGNNMGYSYRLHEGMRNRVRELVDRYDRKISLIGWSLGGVFAREVARAIPNDVRLVITLGSPIQRDARARPPLPVPSTALYSEEDRIVPARYARETPGERAESVRVPGGHVGLGSNPFVLEVIADRLAQDPLRWRRFEGWSPFGAAVSVA